MMEETIRRLRKLSEKATPGPWVKWEGHSEGFCDNDGENTDFSITGNRIFECDPSDLPDIDGADPDEDEYLYEEQAGVNAELICAMRNSLDELLTPERGGVALIAAERRRQIEKEGWDARHDDNEQHRSAELAQAAICYANTARLQARFDISAKPDGIAKDWPWERHWWKPSPDPIRNLVKAGALIAAEIDRLQRKQPEEGKNDGR